jgi:hypothetical protein
MRFLAFFVLLTAIAIAACGAYFSIVGLTLLFVGGGMSIIVMGTALEVGKIVAATFLKQKWDEITLWLKTYLVLATILLMAITSIGIYGYLSAGYTATSIAVQGYERQIELNTTKIQELDKEISFLKQDAYNQSEIEAVDATRKSFATQRLKLIDDRNKQIEKLRSSTDTKDASGDVSTAKQALDTAKASLDSDTAKELEQIKLYNNRLEILDQEVKKWLDEGSGGMFKKNGLDKARETKDLQKKDRDDIDVQIKNSQDRIEKLRTGYTVQVKEYNDRVATIEGRVKSQRGETDASIKNLEKENADAMVSISAYNKECDEKIAALNTKKGELTEQNKKKIVEDQATIQTLHAQIDSVKEKIVHTDVGTFKFIAKSLNIPLDNAVNYFIWLIMSVFDPLAVCLILVFNMLIGGNKKTKSLKQTDTPEPTPTPQPTSTPVPIETSKPTSTLVSTSTSEPTPTPVPTETVAPTPAPTSIFEETSTPTPIEFVKPEQVSVSQTVVDGDFISPVPPPPRVPHGITSGKSRT